jgi:hypothetical protein
MTPELPRPPSEDKPSSADVLCMRRAGARLAIQYLERAEDWVACVDEDIVSELLDIRRRILGHIDALNGHGKGR